MELHGEHCLVRPWRAGDVDALVRHANNVHVSQQLRDRFPHPYTAAAGRRFINSLAGLIPVTNFAIVIEGEAAGGVGFSPLADIERYSAEIGYWLGEPFWGRGIAAEALTLVTRYAFTQCGLLRLFALPFADNSQSIRVLEKAGYTLEGILRASSVKFGEPRDQALYARVNTEWNAR